MDFYKISKRENRKTTELYPDFVVGRAKDLMVRGKTFYAVWDEEAGLWSQDEYDVQRLVDEDLRKHHQEYVDAHGTEPSVKYLGSFGSASWVQYRKFINQISDNSKDLDSKLTFKDDVVKRTDYVSRRLPYSLIEGDYSAWDELVGTLYSVEERAKIEWAIGAVIAGDAKKIQKFLVFYGAAGTGKSTVLNIVEKLFEGYTTTFEAKALGSSNGGFSTEVFKHNPLVAIQHDGDLSKMDDNTRLNSIISHEKMVMNEKYKASYSARVNAFLFMGTNQPVRISDAKSGIIRRLIDVNPTGVTIKYNHYSTLMSRIDFELGAIAHHCLQVYLSMGKNAYDGYRPVEMMFQTDPFFNFVEAYYDVFKAQDGSTLRQAYSLYKEYCDESGIKPFPQYKIREELRNYFEDFHARIIRDDKELRSYYSGFNFQKFKKPAKDSDTFSLVLGETTSLLDGLFALQPAQLSKSDGTPSKSWSTVDTRLHELDTTKEHYLKVPESHIVIDFDLKDGDGGKSLERNLAAATLWPPTYAELSKSGAGIHLHYTYGGDTSTLSSRYSDGIEIKVFTGNSSLRRRLSKCNNVPVSEIVNGLPLKEKKPMIEVDTMKSEKGIRDLIARNLKKEIHPGTKPSIDFIKKILDDAQKSGMPYDVSDLRPKIIAFANNSSNRPLECLKIVQKMRFQGLVEAVAPAKAVTEDRLVFFDVEVYPNLFVICWKYAGDPTIVRMINPSSEEVEALFSFKLVGYNNRRYDNHILWGRFMGYSLEQLYKLSTKIIDNVAGASFGEAYGLSYADLYEFSSKKQSLKKFEIELGLPHVEMDLPWDEPVPESEWKRVSDYCANDVFATEVVFSDREQDFVARQILADLSGLTINDTTQKHSAKILFGDDKNPQSKFVYTDLSTIFPGYKYDFGVSTYRDETVGEGGYVYAEPGMYENVALLDVVSMHPTSIELLNAFGEYTSVFSELKQARVAIKRQDYGRASSVLAGRLAKFLGHDSGGSNALSDALKIVINIIYGLTSAKFDNPFRDTRNKDNIVAKRGALFMIDLKHAVQEKGYTVAHIKTDSIKIPNADRDIIDFVCEFGKKYGYEFDHEATYDRLCLVNDAVYIAKKEGSWTAVGAQFAHPYVYKTLFSGEEVTFEDLCETKQVTQGAMYLDFEAVNTPMALGGSGVHFVGRSGRFTPVTAESGGGILWRIKDDKRYAVAGTKGYLWLESGVAKSMGPLCEVDMIYHDQLAHEARAAIEKFGSFEDFVK